MDVLFCRSEATFDETDVDAPVVDFVFRGHVATRDPAEHDPGDENDGERPGWFSVVGVIDRTAWDWKTSGFEHDSAGDWWFIVRRLQDDEWIEVSRTDARNVRF